jgi:hypothetical protein
LNCICIRFFVVSAVIAEAFVAIAVFWSPSAVFLADVSAVIAEAFVAIAVFWSPSAVISSWCFCCYRWNIVVVIAVFWITSASVLAVVSAEIAEALLAIAVFWDHLQLF